MAEKLKIEYLPISEIKPYSRNPRKNDKAVDVVAKSIKEFGFKNPIILDKGNEIIAGHTRLKAAEKLGLKEVPIIRAEDLTEEQVKAFRIMDNKSSEKSEWDIDLLKEELIELQNSDFRLDLTGFSFKELGGILENEITEDIVEVDAYERAKAKTKIEQGEIYELGYHRLMCGDSTEKSHVEALMGEQRANMVFTDPPYNVDFKGSVHSTGEKSKNSKFGAIKNDKMSDRDWYVFITKFLKNFLEFCDGAIYICMSCKELHNITKSFIEVGGHWSNYIIWKKNNFTLSRKDYNSKYEPILYGWREGINHYYCGGNSKVDIWEIDRTSNNDLHPTMKPVGLCAEAIRNSSQPNEIVLDLFGGSGSTLIACEQLNRKCFMMELDPVYCQVIINRWEKFTGKTAKKL